MKKLPVYLFLALLVGVAIGCSSDNKETESDIWSKYEDWRKANDEWLATESQRTNPDGTPYYQRLSASWDPDAYVLIRYCNDTTLTRGNLRPFSTSWVDVKYRGRLYNDAVFDSSYTQTQHGDSIARFQLTSVVTGWMMGLTNMHVGDSVELVIPYEQGFYAQNNNGPIPPYSVLRFNARLVDIPYWEIQNPDANTNKK